MSKNNAQNLLSQVIAQLSDFYKDLIRKMEDTLFQSPALKRKSISQLSGKIFKIVNENKGNARQASQTKDIFLKVIESHLTNFINNQIIIQLIKCNEDYSFAEIFTRRWNDYKRIVFSFFTFFIHIKDYYQTARVTYLHKNKGNPNKQQLSSLPLPIPVIAINLFTTMILRRFQNRIKKAVLVLLKRERQLSEPSNNDLRLLFQAIWSCSLKQLARIAISKDAVYFLKEQRKQYTTVFPQAANNELFINNYVLKEASNAAAIYYAELSLNLKQLDGLQQIQMIHLRCCVQEEIASFHLPSKASITTYLESINKQLILFDFSHILRKTHGFKYVITHYKHSSGQFEKEIETFFKVIKRVEASVIDQVSKVIDQVISERGAEIREKINKPKQFMTQMLQFKKSLRKIFDSVDSVKIEVSMEKGFKNLMDGFQVSKCLADFTDFTIRQCSRLKLDESSSEERLKEIVFMLASIGAKDLFLAYHQDAMAKRLIESLNEPKIQHELLLLKMLAENLGNVVVSQHFSMIKDVENGIETTQHISQLLPFISYKWDLRVMNSSSWPESALKMKFAHIQPPSILRTHLYQLQDLYKQYKGFGLQWRLDRGHSLFEGHFFKGKWRFQAQNIYLIILLHFNDHPNYTATFGKLSQLLTQKKQNQSVNHLQNYLKVLIQNKLIIRDKSKSLSDDFIQNEALMVNREYSPSEQMKAGQTITIKMSQQLAKSFNQSNVQINKVLKDREKLVDALLVKLLKHAHSTGSNRITFMELYEGIKSNSYLSNFNFSQTWVKERLQQLITKQYCRRDEQDRRVYHYIA